MCHQEHHVASLSLLPFPLQEQTGARMHCFKSSWVMVTGACGVPGWNGGCGLQAPSSSRTACRQRPRCCALRVLAPFPQLPWRAESRQPSSAARQIRSPWSPHRAIWRLCAGSFVLGATDWGSPWLLCTAWAHLQPLLTLRSLLTPQAGLPSKCLSFFYVTTFSPSKILP